MSQRKRKMSSGRRRSAPALSLAALLLAASGCAHGRAGLRPDAVPKPGPPPSASQRPLASTLGTNFQRSVPGQMEVTTPGVDLP